jgi:hypothetical protein
MTNWTGTSAAKHPDPYRAPEELIAALLRFSMGPKLIGSLMGRLVYLDASVPPAQIEIRDGARTMRFGIDHPYIKGTQLEACALTALGDGETASSGRLETGETK